MSNKMWGGRFQSAPHAIMEEINASIDFDRKLALQDIAGSKAHVAMLAETGIWYDAADTTTGNTEAQVKSAWWQQIAAADPHFRADGFIDGARHAFDLIVKSYADGDTATLRPLFNAAQGLPGTVIYRALGGAPAPLVSRNRSAGVNTNHARALLQSEQLQRTEPSGGSNSAS